MLNVWKTTAGNKVSQLEQAAYKHKLITRDVQIESRSFKIYSADPFKLNPVEPLLASMIRNVRSGEVVYDVDSNKGLFSISIAQKPPQLRYSLSNLTQELF